MLIIALFGMSNVCHADTQDAASRQIPYKRESVAAGGDFSRFAIGLTVGVLALAGALFVLRRRLGQNGGDTAKPKQLRVLETQRLNPKAMLYVIEFAGSQYLIAQSEHGINCLANAPASPNTHMERAG